jgi:hypothetical protein
MINLDEFLSDTVEPTDNSHMNEDDYLYAVYEYVKENAGGNLAELDFQGFMEHVRFLRETGLVNT